MGTHVSDPNQALPATSPSDEAAGEKRVKRTRPRARWRLLSSIVSLGVAVVAGDVFLRYYLDVVTYKRSAAVDRIQKYLEARPDIGYVWRPNVDRQEGISLNWADQDPEHGILSTDQWGFRNHPDAIADRRLGRPVDVVGIGDSFMEMAARPFYESFKGRSLAYHSFAMHRMCTPQYNIAPVRPVGGTSSPWPDRPDARP